MTDLATIADVQVLYQALDAAETARVQRLLRLASSVARSQAPDIDGRIAAGALDRELVADVVASAVIRVLRNPEGIKAQSVGPMAVTYDDRVSAGRVYFTADDLALLRPPVRTSAVRSIRLVAGLGYGLEQRHWDAQ